MTFTKKEHGQLLEKRANEFRKMYPHASVPWDGLAGAVTAEKLYEAFEQIELLKERIIRLENGIK